MLDVLWGLFIVMIALDVLAWALVLSVAGTLRLVKRLFRALTPYR